MNLSIDHQGALCVNALANRLNVSQSAVSQHLRVLRQTGLVSSERNGSFVHYSLDQDRLEQHNTNLLATLGDINMSIIEARDLTKHYGKVRGIRDVNLKFKVGEIFGFWVPMAPGKRRPFVCYST